MRRFINVLKSMPLWWKWGMVVILPIMILAAINAMIKFPATANDSLAIAVYAQMGICGVCATCHLWRKQKDVLKRVLQCSIFALTGWLFSGAALEIFLSQQGIYLSSSALSVAWTVDAILFLMTIGSALWLVVRKVKNSLYQ